MAPFRTAMLAALLGCAGAALLPSHKAEAWWVRAGYGYPGYWRAPVVVAPPVVAYAPPPVVYAPPYRAHWFPAFYDRWGRWHPAHWG